MLSTSPNLCLAVAANWIVFALPDFSLYPWYTPPILSRPCRKASDNTYHCSAFSLNIQRVSFSTLRSTSFFLMTTLQKTAWVDSFVYSFLYWETAKVPPPPPRLATQQFSAYILWPHAWIFVHLQGTASSKRFCILTDTSRMLFQKVLSN